TGYSWHGGSPGMSDAFRRRMFTVAAACAVVAARPVHAGFKAHARNFECLLEGTKPAGKNFYVFHRNRRKLARAVAIAESGAPGETYPVGTILQLVAGWGRGGAGRAVSAGGGRGGVFQRRGGTPATGESPRRGGGRGGRPSWAGAGGPTGRAGRRIPPSGGGPRARPGARPPPP